MDSWDTQKTFVEARLVRKTLNLSLLVTILIVRNKVIKHMNVDKRLEKHLLHLDLRDIATTIKSMDIEHKNVYLRKNLIGKQKSKKMHLRKVTLMIGITLHDIVVIIVENTITF